MAGDALKTYKAKRNFGITSEPAEGGQANEAARSFVIQKHWATRLHYDFRLEMDGSMKSWAVPKGPSLDPRDKRMAVHVKITPFLTILSKAKFLPNSTARARSLFGIKAFGCR